LEKKMKAKLQVIVSVMMLLTLILTACAPTATTEVPPEQAAPTEAVEVEPTATTAAVEEEPTATEAAGEATATVEATAEPTEAAGGGGRFWTIPVKQAIAAAIDREVLVDRTSEGRNIPAYHMIPPGYPFATEPFLDKYGTRDLDMARQLLEEAGYSESNPFELELWYPPEHYGTGTADVMQVLKEQLEETGMITVTLNSQNWAEYVDSFVAGEAFPAFILGWFPDFVDPETWLTPFGSCTASPDQGIFYCNEEMDALLLEGGSTTDEAQREAVYQQVGELWAEEVVTIPLFWEPEFITNRPGIEGIAIGPPFEFNYYPLTFGDGATPASGQDDTIIIGTTDEINSLDPQDSYATHDWELLKNTNIPLMNYTPGTAELVPGAAEAAPEVSEDGLTYTFTLREGLQFSDGTPVTAQDYVRGWERINGLEGQVSGLVQAYVSDVQAPDERTVVYTLKAPFAFFPALAATPPFIPPHPETFTDDAINQFPDSLEGIGPYRIVSVSPDEQVVLEANPNYFGEQPGIPNVIIRYFQDPTTMSQAVESGEIDIAWRTVGPVEAARLEGVEGLTVTTVDAPSLRYLVLNNNYAGTE
jgi:peptide/nickel transport system substrate-binding protein